MLVDNGSVINVIPLLMVRRLQKLVEDLIHIEVSITTFAKEITRSLRMLPIALTMGITQAALIVFFVVKSSLSYNAILGRDWIHSNSCVPSLLH